MNAMTKYRERDCDAFRKWRRRHRCKNILRGFKLQERVTKKVMYAIMWLEVLNKQEGAQ